MALTPATESTTDSGLNDLIPIVYAELRQIAHAYTRRERRPHSLDTSAVVHELYLRLARSANLDVHQKSQFLALAAQTMRRILVDEARQRKAGRRGGGAENLPLLETAVADRRGSDPIDVLALDQALLRLSGIAPQQARVVELRFFAGLTIEETAEALEVSTATVKREWTAAKAWLARELGARRPRSSGNRANR